MSRLRIATRGSALALAQARAVAASIETQLAVATELVTLKTSGDRLAGSLAAFGGKGLFVKEIEEALLEGRADLAVHSAKDLPGVLTHGLQLAAFPERADARDALVAGGAVSALEDLARGARVGTGSLRRRSQLLARRPDLRVEPLRGNVDSRLRALDRGTLDAVVLACAGLDRLGLGARIRERIAPERMLPAVGQGVLAIEVRDGDPIAGDLAVLDHAPTRIRIRAERAFLARLGGDCYAPLAAHATLEAGDLVRLRGLLASEDGSRRIDAEAIAPASDPEAAGRRAAEDVLARGGEELLAALPRAAAP